MLSRKLQIELTKYPKATMMESKELSNDVEVIPSISTIPQVIINVINTNVVEEVRL